MQTIPVFNVDGSLNEGGSINEIVDIIMRYNTCSERMQLAVTKLGSQSMLLGFNWLRKHNPAIDWQTRDVKMVHCPSSCNTCQVEAKIEHISERVTAQQIRACRSGGFPVLIEEVED